MNDKQLKAYHEELEKVYHKIAVQRGVIWGLITFITIIALNFILGGNL